MNLSQQLACGLIRMTLDDLVALASRLQAGCLAPGVVASAGASSVACLALSSANPAAPDRDPSAPRQPSCRLGRAAPPASPPLCV